MYRIAEVLLVVFLQLFLHPCEIVRGSYYILGCVRVVVTTPCVLPEVRGFSRLYSNIDEYGVPYLIVSLIWFLMFTDCLIYWIHR